MYIDGWVPQVCKQSDVSLHGPTFWNISDRRAFSWMTWRTMRGGSRNSRYATKTEASTKNCTTPRRSQSHVIMRMNTHATRIRLNDTT